jgi:hypothetical protein
MEILELTGTCHALEKNRNAFQIVTSRREAAREWVAAEIRFRRLISSASLTLQVGSTSAGEQIVMIVCAEDHCSNHISKHAKNTSTS